MRALRTSSWACDLPSSSAQRIAKVQGLKRAVQIRIEVAAVAQAVAEENPNIPTFSSLPHLLLNAEDFSAK